MLIEKSLRSCFAENYRKTHTTISPLRSAEDRQRSEASEEPAWYRMTGRDAVILPALRIGGEKISKHNGYGKKIHRNYSKVEKKTYAYFGFVGSS